MKIQYIIILLIIVVIAVFYFKNKKQDNGNTNNVQQPNANLFSQVQNYASQVIPNVITPPVSNNTPPANTNNTPNSSNQLTTVVYSDYKPGDVVLAKVDANAYNGLIFGQNTFLKTIKKGEVIGKFLNYANYTKSIIRVNVITGNNQEEGFMLANQTYVKRIVNI